MHSDIIRVTFGKTRPSPHNVDFIIYRNRILCYPIIPLLGSNEEGTAFSALAQNIFPALLLCNKQIEKNNFFEKKDKENCVKKFKKKTRWKKYKEIETKTRKIFSK